MQQTRANEREAIAAIIDSFGASGGDSVLALRYLNVRCGLESLNWDLSNEATVLVGLGLLDSDGSLTALVRSVVHARRGAMHRNRNDL